ncbi:hypothetical protein HY090_01005 [Candidatus Kaiserbacteria bacterium]|nr:hypothetical protein [Candidatus Kaiserbacteria bacterium]
MYIAEYERPEGTHESAWPLYEPVTVTPGIECSGINEKSIESPIFNHEGFVLLAEEVIMVMSSCGSMAADAKKGTTDARREAKRIRSGSFRMALIPK